LECANNGDALDLIAKRTREIQKRRQNLNSEIFRKIPYRFKDFPNRLRRQCALFNTNFQGEFAQGDF